MFSRDFRRQEGAKFKIYFSFEDCRASVVALSLGRWSCPLGAGGRALCGFRTCRRLALVLWSCVPSFCPLSCFVLGASLANVALFRAFRAFLARSWVFVWVCVVLVLCVVCVAFVRV